MEDNFKHSDQNTEIEEETLARYKNTIILLENKLKDSHDENRCISEELELIKGQFEDEISEHKVTFDENKMLKAEDVKKGNVILQLKQEKQHVEIGLEASESNVKKSNKVIKSKEKEIYDVKKENLKVKEDYDQIKLEYMTLKSQVNKEKKDQEKKNKKQEKRDLFNNLRSVSITNEVCCDSCDVKLPDFEKLQAHVRFMHRKQGSTQTQEKVTEDKVVQEPLEPTEKCVQTLSEKHNVFKEMLFPEWLLVREGWWYGAH